MVDNSNVGSQDMAPDGRPASRASSQESWKLDTGIDLLLEFGHQSGEMSGRLSEAGDKETNLRERDGAVDPIPAIAAQSTQSQPPRNIPTMSSASDIHRHLLDPSGVESNARDAPSYQRAPSQESWELDTGIDLLLEFGETSDRLSQAGDKEISIHERDGAVDPIPAITAQSTQSQPPRNIPTMSSASDIHRHLLGPSGVESNARDGPSYQRAPSQESWELDTGIDLLLEFGHMSDRLSQAGDQETSSREKDGAVDLFPAQSTQSTDGQPPGNIGEVPTMSSGSDTYRHLLQPDSSGVESDARDAPSSHRSVPMSQDVEMEDMYHPPRPQSTSVPAALRASLGGQDKPNTGSLSQPPRSSGEDRPVWLKDTLRDHIRWIADRKKTILRELEDLDSQIAVLESLVAAYVIPTDASSEGLKV